MVIREYWGTLAIKVLPPKASATLVPSFNSVTPGTSCWKAFWLQVPPQSHCVCEILNSSTSYPPLPRNYPRILLPEGISLLAPGRTFSQLCAVCAVFQSSVCMASLYRSQMLCSSCFNWTESSPTHSSYKRDTGSQWEETRKNLLVPPNLNFRELPWGSHSPPNV